VDVAQTGAAERSFDPEQAELLAAADWALQLM
jgi:hypothetical protein